MGSAGRSTVRNVTAGRATLPTLPFVALLLFGLVSHPAHAATAPATSVRTVSPVDSSGQLKGGYKVVRHLGHATCQTGSFMTDVADRCSTPATHHSVLDPCWPLATAMTFVCQAKPWQHDVVQVRTSGGVSDGPGNHGQELPWGMRVGGKVRCLLDPGSVRKLNGHRLLFHCSHHRDVFGPLRRHPAHWTAHVYDAHAHTRSGYRSLGRRSVRIAWYGAQITPPASPSPSPSPILTAPATPTPAP